MLVDNHPTAKAEAVPPSTVATTTASLSTTTSTLHTTTTVKSTSSSATDTTVCSSAAKSELPNHVPAANSTNAVPNACISRVVTTTITTSSGGKTVTKPLTILYASPSKLTPQVNGHIAANCPKPVTVCSTGQVSQLSNLASTSGISAAKVVVKQERKSPLCNDIGHSQTFAINDTGKLLNDVAGHLNNVKPKIPLDSVRTAALTTASSSGSGTTNNSVARTIALSPSSATLANSAGVAAGGTKLASASAPTKLIVLTSGTGGNIIKTIASAGFAGGAAAQLASGAIVNLGAGAGAGTGPLRSVVGAVNPAAASTSPGRIIQGVSSATPVATSSAINSICAAAGVDAFSGQCEVLVYNLLSGTPLF